MAKYPSLMYNTIDYLLGGNLVMRNGKIDKYLFDGGYCQATAASSTTDTFTAYYYTKDHLGDNREVVDGGGNVKQQTNYYPFGATYYNTTNSMNPDFQPYKYNGKELDKMHGLNTYDYGARQHDPILGRWDRMDPLCEKYYGVSPYNYCANNPVNAIDPDGKKTLLFATRLPNYLGSFIPDATHTFIAVFDDRTNQLRAYFAFGSNNGLPWGPLENPHFDPKNPKAYPQDWTIIKEYQNGTAGDDDRCKSAWSIYTEDSSKQEQFDDKIIATGNSYEPISTTEYDVAPSESNGTVNCNKGSYNLLKQAGVSEDLLDYIGERLPGKVWGWGQNMPWTKDEQYNEFIQRMLDGTWATNND